MVMKLDLNFVWTMVAAVGAGVCARFGWYEVTFTLGATAIHFAVLSALWEYETLRGVKKGVQ